MVGFKFPEIVRNYARAPALVALLTVVRIQLNHCLIDWVPSSGKPGAKKTNLDISHNPISNARAFSKGLFLKFF